MERSVLQGLAAFRWAAWAWMAFVLLVAPGSLVRPWLAYFLVGAALAFTAACTLVWRRSPGLLVRPVVVGAELVLGASLLALDGLVRAQSTVFSTGQSLASVWPLAGVMTAGVALGPWGGAAAGVGMGLARLASTLLNGVDSYGGGRGLSLASTGVFYAVAGAVFGYVFVLIQRAREEVAAARAREEVARTLHDGVLQTLALVERRASDPALARLARDQERELRAYLFGDGQAPDTDLAAALRAAAGRVERAHGARVQVLVPGDLGPVAPERVGALAGAVAEALTNAAKHGAAGPVVVFVEQEEGGRVFCSVRDDGPGFDPATTPEGVGLGRSIRGRIEGRGGRVEVASRPGAGTEVRLWL